MRSWQRLKFLSVAENFIGKFEVTGDVDWGGAVTTGGEGESTFASLAKIAVSGERGRLDDDELFDQDWEFRGEPRRWKSHPHARMSASHSNMQDADAKNLYTRTCQQTTILLNRRASSILARSSQSMQGHNMTPQDQNRTLPLKWNSATQQAYHRWLKSDQNKRLNISAIWTLLIQKVFCTFRTHRHVANRR